MFIRLKERIVNTDTVQEFTLCDSTIMIHYTNGRHASIAYRNKEEAAAAHEDILHMIDNNYIPSWVQTTPITQNPDYGFSGTGDWYGDIPF